MTIKNELRNYILSINHFNWKSVSHSFWSNLAMNIIYRACMDYEDYLVALYFEKDPKKSHKLYGDFKEVRDFFGSDWWYVLTDIDHKKILQALNKKVRDRIKKKQVKVKYVSLWGSFGEE